MKTQTRATSRPMFLFIAAILGTSCTRTIPAPVVARPLPACAAATPAPRPAQPVNVMGGWDLRWDRTFAGWQPSIFNGRLTLDRDGERWTGELAFKESDAKHVVESMTIEGERVAIAFRPTTATPDDRLEFMGWVRDGRIVGEMRWGKVPWTPVSGRRWPQLKPATVDHSLPVTSFGSASNDALRALIEHASAEKSSAIVILKDGQIGIEMYRDGYDGGPLPAMSASKSVASLAVGLLIAEGKLSLDTRMGSLFPDWKGEKATITVRHLLTHTSGLDPSRADFEAETIREHARKAKLVFPPGSRFQYNNGAVDFLAVVVKQASGQALDEYLAARLFKKLDIVDASWMKDSEGTPRAAGELIIRPVDLAKIGQLMLDEGRWKGEPIIPAAWVAKSIEPGQRFDEDCGLLWWREAPVSWVLTDEVLAAWRATNVAASTLKDARDLVGKRFAGRDEYLAALRKRIGNHAFEQLNAALQAGDHVPWSAKISSGPAEGFSARGWLGQTLVVIPSTRTVGVRMRAADPEDYREDAERNAYDDFARDVTQLFRH